jgi:hypothetical protein
MITGRGTEKYSEEPSCYIKDWEIYWMRLSAFEKEL